MTRRIGQELRLLKKGTPLERGGRRWREFRNRRRRVWWKEQEEHRTGFVARIQPGVRMRLRFQSDMARLIYCEAFECQEREFLNAFAKKGDVFVDVGANIGLFSLIASRRVGASGSVFAFEPAKRTFLGLCENVAINGVDNVHCVQKALSDSEDILSLFASNDGFDDYNSFARPIGGASFSTENVSCTTWDTFAAENGLVGKVTMMKLDVEGWETRTLQGARASLSRPDAPLLQVEFTDEASASAGSSCTRLYHLLEDLGYQMFIYNPWRNELVQDPLRPSYPYLNLIATKRPDEARARLRCNPIVRVFFEELIWC